MRYTRLDPPDPPEYPDCPKCGCQCHAYGVCERCDYNWTPLTDEDHESIKGDMLDHLEREGEGVADVLAATEADWRWEEE